MPSLPVPIFVALALGFLGLRAWFKGETPRPLLVLIAACAVQAAMVAGRLHYGIEGLRLVQPGLVMGLPALAWADLWHLAGPAFGLFCAALAPEALDPVIVAAFLGYGGAMLLALRGGEMAHARLAAGERPQRLWRWVALALIASALSDMVILTAVMAGHGDWLGWLVTLFSTASLLLLGGLMLAEEAATVAEPEEAPVATEGDAALVAAMERLMEERRLWQDPDLTLARIARRLGVPAKVLSAAVNRVKGENISRVVNGWRVAHAGGLLKGGASVTEAMLGSGFATKSNFNREFLRVTGKAPREWKDGG